MSENQQAEQRVHERLVDAFLLVEKEVKYELERFENGEFITDIISNFIKDRNADNAKARYLSYKQYVRDLIEKHNVALTDAKNSMRSVVQLGPTQWRGAEVKADIVSYKGFTVSSVTKRSFDTTSLVNHLERVGALARYMTITTTNKDGQPVPIIQQVLEVNYDAVKKQLVADGLQAVITAAYDEKEGTPQAKGPKPITYMGELKEK